MNPSISATLGDITQIKIDTVVNAANSSLLGGGGVDGAIHEAAGPNLLQECRSLGGCKPGEAKITKAYRLSVNYIIHTVGPIWYGGTNEEPDILARCYVNSLGLAEKYSQKSIAFPCISTGAYRFPVAKAAAIATSTVAHYFKENQSQINKVVFVCFSAEDLDEYKKIILN